MESWRGAWPVRWYRLWFVTWLKFSETFDNLNIDLNSWIRCMGECCPCIVFCQPNVWAEVFEFINYVDPLVFNDKLANWRQNWRLIWPHLIGFERLSQGQLFQLQVLRYQASAKLVSSHFRVMQCRRRMWGRLLSYRIQVLCSRLFFQCCPGCSLYELRLRNLLQIFWRQSLSRWWMVPVHTTVVIAKVLIVVPGDTPDMLTDRIRCESPRQSCQGCHGVVRY